MFHLIAWIVLGAISGFIAHKIVGEPGQGFLMNTGLGIVGALIGGEVMNAMGKHEANGLNLYSLAVAVAGSIVLLVIVNLLKKMRSGA